MKNGAQDIPKKLQIWLDRQACGPVLIHSDLIGVMGLLGAPRAPTSDVLRAHMQVLEQICDGRLSYFPTFNYDFPRSKVYDLSTDPSQVGQLSEHVRLSEGMWRSAVPIFNVSGRQPCQLREARADIVEEIDPFGVGSIFELLYQQNGAILFYGAPFDAFTGVHFIERMSGGAAYRYDKIFSGLVRFPDGRTGDARLNYHVRPLGRTLRYDLGQIMPHILEVESGLRIIEKGVRIFALNFRPVVDLLLASLARDPFIFLAANNRIQWENELMRLGRRVQLADFEGEADGH